MGSCSLAAQAGEQGSAPQPAPAPRTVAPLIHGQLNHLAFALGQLADAVSAPADKHRLRVTADLIRRLRRLIEWADANPGTQVCHGDESTGGKPALRIFLGPCSAPPVLDPVAVVLGRIAETAQLAADLSPRDGPQAADLSALSAALRSVLAAFTASHRPDSERRTFPTTALAVRPQEPRRMTAQLVKVPFRGKDLFAVEKDGDRYIPLRPYCDVLHLALQSQLAKLKGYPWAVVTMIVTTGADGKSYEMACLPLRAFPMWLTTIHPSKVKPEAREDLALYQTEAADVLYKHFLGSHGSPPDINALIEAAVARALAAGPRPSALPVVGEQDARVYILGPMRQIARKRARLTGARWRSISKTLDNELREAAGYPMVRDASWEMMPRDKLAIVHRKLTRWQRDVDETLAQRLDAEAPSQLPLAG